MKESSGLFTQLTARASSPCRCRGLEQRSPSSPRYRDHLSRSMLGGYHGRLAGPYEHPHGPRAGGSALHGCLSDRRCVPGAPVPVACPTTQPAVVGQFGKPGQLGGIGSDNEHGVYTEGLRPLLRRRRARGDGPPAGPHQAVSGVKDCTTYGAEVDIDLDARHPLTRSRLTERIFYREHAEAAPVSCAYTRTLVSTNVFTGRRAPRGASWVRRRRRR
jgi:hypothetical protein